MSTFFLPHFPAASRKVLRHWDVDIEHKSGHRVTCSVKAYSQAGALRQARNEADGYFGNRAAGCKFIVGKCYAITADGREKL
jgi:hypothetical protein